MQTSNSINRRIACAFITFLIAAGSALAAENLVKEQASLSATEILRFDHPERFSYDVIEQPDDMFQPAMRLRSFDKQGISSMNFKVFVAKDDQQTIKTQKHIDTAVKKMSAGYVSGSVEKTDTLHQIQQKNGVGAYCVFTDADLVDIVKLRPGQFRHITLNLLKIGDYVLTIRGYSNSKDDDDYKAMLSLLEGLRIEKTTPAAKSRKTA